MSAEPCAPAPALTLTSESPDHAPHVEALVDRAFGPGRYTKVSERVREIAEFAPELSAVAVEDGRVLGVARIWRIAVGGEPITFLGPLAVEATDRKAGLGALLVEHACKAAEAAGEAAVLLVGDLPYFARVGFEVAGGVTLPGPVDANRVLVRRFRDVAVTGALTGR
jgi:predicted N-acetyltransferase YhbS